MSIINYKIEIQRKVIRTNIAKLEFVKDQKCY